MKNVLVKRTPEVDLVFTNYPDIIREKMLELRDLVLETASEVEGIVEIQETLKWGEPSYITKIGSTLRMDWKPKKPDQYALYFKCTSKLVDTFRSQFKDRFEFEGNRAIVFNLDDKLPKQELKQCIEAALRYHKVKHLPGLGIHSNHNTNSQSL